jgi:plasmid maintenance system antidote protein VapI
VTFQDLHERLVRHLNRCVHTGQITERGLAKRAGISQPHIHNVLKGRRLLSWDSADRLLHELQLDALALPDEDES